MTTEDKKLSGKIDKERVLKKISSRHHYIPEFLTKGFTDKNGKVFVFDKDTNQILTKQKYPKSIFYEYDRNTVPVTNDIESSFIENEFYNNIDDKGSKTITHFRNEKLKTIEFTVENTGHLTFFLIVLFWRIPYTDYASKDAIDRSEINSPGFVPDVLRNDPFFGKTQRSTHAKHMIEEMKRSGRKGSFFVNIHEIKSEAFVIGDNPILFRKTSNLFGELFNNDFLFAISSNRIYSSSEEPLENFSIKNTLLFNASIIKQSTRYVCSNNRDALERSIKLFQYYQNEGIGHLLMGSTFTKHE